MASVEGIIEKIRSTPEIHDNIVSWRTLKRSEGAYADFPESIDPRLIEAFRMRGIERLYSHQRSAVDTVLAGKDLVIVTPTASGKTLCYNLPVLNAILTTDKAKALYLFPTKALSQDQVAELHAVIDGLPERERPVYSYTYDGDTPPTIRKKMRETGDIVVTNPYMLHAGILPNHPKWVNLFLELKYVVIDEIHHYRGVFGSHMGNIIRRLSRICRHYGSDPVFICCSATIANPCDLAGKLIGRDAELIHADGSPRGEKHFLFYNPPLVNREMGLRADTVGEIRALGELLILNGIQTIFFARSRNEVEIITKYLKDMMIRHNRDPEQIQGYRGGYLPNLRREIEAGLREGEILGVVATNALELGVDIGSLDSCVMTGYPGSVASAWQQAGRAGRRAGTSIALLAARNTAIDQYIMNHPEYFFDRSEQNVIINPDNDVIQYNHVKCSAFEVPFAEGDHFGSPPDAEKLSEILQFLEYDARILHKVKDRWFWMADSYPAEGVSINAADMDEFIIHDVSFPEVTRQSTLAQIDRPSAMTMIHPEAIYQHQGDQYLIEELDYENRIAYAGKVNVDYYTDAETETDLQVKHIDQEAGQTRCTLYHGEVAVTTQATMFKKIKFYTHENVGAGDIHLPPEKMDTTSFWFTLSGELANAVRLYEGSNSGALVGLCYALRSTVPLFVRCDIGDIRVTSESRSPHFGLATVYVYDNVPSGVGLSEKVMEIHGQIFEAALEIVERCECNYGCPACVSPSSRVGPQGKQIATRILSALAPPE